MNFLFLVFAVLFGGISGLYFSSRLKEREDLLSSSLLLVDQLAVQIRYVNGEIGEILKNAGENSSYEKLAFVKNCGDIGQNGDFHEAWSGGVREQPYLNQKDREILFELGKRLGETDLEGQLSFLEMTRELLERQRDEARDDSGKKCGMYRSVGILCGLAVGIMTL